MAVVSRRDAVMMAMGALLASYAIVLQQSVRLWSDGSITVASWQPTVNGPRHSSTGWKAVYLYHSNDRQWIQSLPDRFILRSGLRWLAQHGQDVAVAKVLEFRRDGFFVDLAANDAVWASNTVVLEQVFGWKGLCIEANPHYWQRLVHRQCTVVGVVVGAWDGALLNVTLNPTKEVGPFGGIVGAEFDNKQAKLMEQHISVSLTSLLDHFGAPSVIDYLSLDVEGAETFILRHFAFDRYRIRCLTIERPTPELSTLLQHHGYRHILDLAAGDTLWVEASLAAQARANLGRYADEIKNHQVHHFPSGLAAVGG